MPEQYIEVRKIFQVPVMYTCFTPSSLRCYYTRHMSILLNIQGLNKSYGADAILRDLSFSVSDKQKIGVIGRNGAGKTTLFKMLVGDEQADSGDIRIQDGTRIGYVRQHDDHFLPSETVMQFFLRATGKERWQCAKMAAQFHIKNENLERTIGSFAGGFQMRIKLIEMLLHEPNLLLLDEPTNYLDLSTLLLLEAFLRGYTGSFLLISHDREFLKRTCNETLEIAHGKAVHYAGNIESYLAYKIEQEAFAERYNKKIAREKRHLQSFVDRFRYKASKAAQAQSKLKQIARLQTIDMVHPIRAARIQIPSPERKKGVALRVSDLSIGYGGTPVASNISFDVDRGEHVAIVGNNGQGKTTFLKTIACALSPLSGSFRWGAHMDVGYYAQHVPHMLDPKMDVYTHLSHAASGTGLKEQDVLHMASNFLFRGDELEKPVSVLSGGEKARLCLAGLLLQKNDALLLDEPTNHLDFETVEALAFALSETMTTIFFVSHNRTFVNEVATAIIEVRNGQVKRYHHDYESYVYALKRRLELKPESAPLDAEAKQDAKHERTVLYALIKKEKRVVQDIEEDLMDLERKKQKLLAWFAENPRTYSPIKNDQLSAINTALHEAEQQWLAAQQKVEALEHALAKQK